VSCVLTSAVKQKAAAEQAAAEKAEREALQKAKMDKAKTQDDRHRANLDALGNLQTLLVSSAGMSAWKG
jgi:hypothetical protein